MLSNAYFLVKSRFDTAENEARQKKCKVLRFAKQITNSASFANLIPLQGHRPRRDEPPARHRPRAAPGRPLRAGDRGRRAERRGPRGDPQGPPPRFWAVDFLGVVLGCIEAKFCK